MKRWLIVFSFIMPLICWIASAQSNWFWDTTFVDWINGIIGTENPTIDASLLDTAKNTINWILWILATIALVICLYAGFKMLTSGWDDKWYKSGVSTLKNAALWLAIIWLSWLIVSAIFWFVELMGWR